MNVVWMLIVITGFNTGYELKHKFPDKAACEKFIEFSGNPNQFCIPGRSLESEFIKE